MKNKTVFFCNECGNETTKWFGRCPACGAWNSLVEEPKELVKKAASSSPSSYTSPAKLNDVDVENEIRFSTGILEFDRVLGGGLVSGSLVLVGGDPGIGKSTLLLQICNALSESGTVLYVSGEESERQIKMRAKRLNVDTPDLYIASQVNMDNVDKAIDDVKPNVLIVDSIQTMYSPNVNSAPGSVSQVREVTMQLMRRAKEDGITVFVVGHVTKDGAIAGPKVLEHMVDCVLYFEGERHQSYRILRAVKNRFGSTNEIGVFEMNNEGLKEVVNPSLALLDGRPVNVAGTCVVCPMEGSRPVLAEVQALTSSTPYGNPRRTANGADYNRMYMIIAVLEKRASLNLSAQDIYLNVIGGLKIDEPVCDLGIALAVASCFRNFVIPNDMVAMGEIGLTGELRSVDQIEKRLAEIEKLGFNECILPAANKKTLEAFKTNLKLHYARNILEALAIVRD